MVVEMADWLKAILGAKYELWVGAWEDNKANKDKFIVSAQQLPGSGPVVDVRTANYKIILLGPQNGQATKLEIMQAGSALVAACIEHAIIPCGAAHIVSLGEAMGPGLTAENRPWAQVNFRLIF